MRLLAAYRSRHPAWAASISLLLSPALAMFYLARGWLGLIYGAIGVLLAYAPPFALSYQAIDYPLWMSALVLVVYRVAASVHVYLVASREPPRPRYPWYARFHNWILLFWLAPLLLALLVRNLLLQPVTIQSGSMRPALQSGDYFFAEKLTYGLGRYSIIFGLGPEPRWGGRLPQRGEIISFAYPPDPTTSYVKRVIGLPGDRIQLRDGRLYLNDVMVDRQPLANSTIPIEAGETLYMEHLPDGLVYPIIETNDVSRGDDTVEWLVPARHYFVMGDNRDNSSDSRFHGVGFIPEGNILGKVILAITWPGGKFTMRKVR